jgi:L-glyceraldehyde 3-phosphate reductase
VARAVWDWGSRKYLLSSLDQSLQRMGLEYVDIFYHHRPDPETPLEETAGALASAVTSGKALYVGISSYPADRTAEMVAALNAHGIHLLIHQPAYNMFNRSIEMASCRSSTNTGSAQFHSCPWPRVC